MTHHQNRGQTLAEQMAEYHNLADCDTFIDSNGEVGYSSNTPDRIGEPPPRPNRIPTSVVSNKDAILF